MADSLDVLHTAVSLLIRAALFAARFSGPVRKRSLQRLASRDVDAKAREILFLRDWSTSSKCRSRFCRNTSTRRARSHDVEFVRDF